MPRYSIRYVCSSPLTSAQPFTLEFDGSAARFSFPDELRDESKLHVTVEVDADGWKQSEIEGQRIIQPMLDALTFTTGQPLLLVYWDFILKDESGEVPRKALWVQLSRVRNAVHARDSEIADASAMLRRNVPPDIGLCWHRYAGHRGYWLDRFVFQWLAFESLAGQTQVARACEKCGHVHSHSGADRAEALRMFQAAEPDMGNREFREEIWGKDRNCVFHGSKYPGPQHLRRLNALFPKLRRASEIEFSRRYGVQDRERPVGQFETHVFCYHFIGWNTDAPASAFAADFPWAAVKREFANRQRGESWFSAPNPQFEYLNYSTQAEGW